MEISNEIKVEKKLNIYQRLSAITNGLMTVAKNLEVGAGASKYKAVGEADVLRSVKPLEVQYGVYSYPVNRTIIESGQIESTGYNGQVKKQLFERIEVTYRFINVDKPEEFIDIISYGDGIDSQDKSVGKAMTYADKYALLKAYKIVTGEDPDQNPSEDLKAATTTKAPVLDKQLLNMAKGLNIEIRNVAAYYKKPVEAITNEELKACIEQKTKALNGGNK